MTQIEPSGSITKLIEELRGGSDSAVPAVWSRYFSKLANIADNGMTNSPGRAVAGEDLASAVLQTVCRKVSIGLYPDLRDRDDLWLMLLTITRCRVVSQNRYENRQKRGGGKVRLATDMKAFQNEAFDLNTIAGGDPTPESVVSLKDSCNYLISTTLRDETTKEIAILKLEGLSNDEIAERLNIVKRTVERKIKLIRSLWEKVLGVNHEGDCDDQDTAG